MRAADVPNRSICNSYPLGAEHLNKSGDIIKFITGSDKRNKVG
jgi:hypothetical protein